MIANSYKTTIQHVFLPVPETHHVPKPPDAFLTGIDCGSVAYHIWY